MSHNHTHIMSNPLPSNRNSVLSIFEAPEQEGSNAQSVSKETLQTENVHPPYRYHDAFELTGYGRLNHWTLISCCFIYVYCSQEMTGIAYIVTPAECDLHLSIREKSFVNAGVFMGIVATGIFWGMMGDFWGRRKVMLPTIILAIIFSFSSALCTAFWAMFLTRFVTGCLVAASSATVLVYLGELHPKTHRDRAISVAIASDQINFVIFPGYAWLILPGTWHFYIGGLLIRPWRMFMMLWGVPGLIGASILFFLPESPKFVLATKGVDTTRKILAVIYACNTKNLPESYPVGKILADTSLLDVHKGIRSRLREIGQLLKPPVRRCFILSHFCMILVNLLCNGLYIWLPAIMNETLKDIGKMHSICALIHIKFMEAELMLADNVGSHHKSVPFSPEPVDCTKSEVDTLTYPLSMGIELIYLVPFVLVIYLIAKVNPPKLYAIIMCTCAINLMLCSVMPQALTAFIFISIALGSGSCSSILTAMAVDVFPTRLRALSLCTMYMAGEFGTCIGICMLSMMQGIFCQIIFFTVAFVVLLSAFCLVRYWPDVKEVRAIMESRHYTY